MIPEEMYADLDDDLDSRRFCPGAIHDIRDAERRLSELTAEERDELYNKMIERNQKSKRSDDLI